MSFPLLTNDNDTGFSVLLCNICTVPPMSQDVRWAKLTKAVPVDELGVVEIGGLELNKVTGAENLV